MQRLRIRLWHSLNDRRRDAANESARALQGDVQELFVRNLEALVPLLDENEPSERLMKAEALREMGRFDEALRLLVQIEGDLAQWAPQLRALAMRKDVCVTKLRLGDLRLTH
jgi:hypothetical protein